MYANAGKEVEKAYGVWLRAPSKNSKNLSLGAKWLRNGQTTWNSGEQSTAEVVPDGRTHPFKEANEIIAEIPLQEVSMEILNHNQGDKANLNNKGDNEVMVMGINTGQDGIVLSELKRRRVSTGIAENKDVEIDDIDRIIGLQSGPKNELEAGSGSQARLMQ